MNQTTNLSTMKHVTESLPLVHIAQAAGFTFGSIAATVSNCVILGVFWSSEKLRRSPGLAHLLVLAGFDLCIGLGAIAEVLAQIRAIYQTEVTKGECLAQFFLIVFGVISSSMFLVLIAWDRVCAIRCPFKYRKADHKRIALRRGLMVTAFTLPLSCGIFVGVDLNSTVLYCNPTVCWSREFGLIWTAVAFSDMIVMLTLYILLVGLSRREARKLSEYTTGEAFTLRELRKQDRLNRVIMTAITVYVFLWITPNVVSFMAAQLKVPQQVQMTLGCMIGMCQTVNASINIVIYAAKSRLFNKQLRRFILYHVLLRHRRGLGEPTLTYGAGTSGIGYSNSRGLSRAHAVSYRSQALSISGSDPDKQDDCEAASLTETKKVRACPVKSETALEERRSVLNRTLSHRARCCRQQQGRRNSARSLRQRTSSASANRSSARLKQTQSRSRISGWAIMMEKAVAVALVHDETLRCGADGRYTASSSSTSSSDSEQNVVKHQERKLQQQQNHDQNSHPIYFMVFRRSQPNNKHRKRSVQSHHRHLPENLKRNRGLLRRSESL